MDVVKEELKVVGAMEKDAEDRTKWRRIIGDSLWDKSKGKEEEEKLKIIIQKTSSKMFYELFPNIVITLTVIFISRSILNIPYTKIVLFNWQQNTCCFRKKYLSSNITHSKIIISPFLNYI